MNRGDNFPQHMQQQPFNDPQYHGVIQQVNERQHQSSRSPAPQKRQQYQNYVDERNNTYSFGSDDDDRIKPSQRKPIHVDAKYGFTQQKVSSPTKADHRQHYSKSFNDDFEEVKKVSHDDTRKSDSMLMERQRKKRMQKMDSIKRHGQDEAPDRNPFMATLKFKQEQKPIDDDDSSVEENDQQQIATKNDRADVNDKRNAYAMSIVKGRSVRHLIVEKSSSEGDSTSDGNKSKPLLIVVDEHKELPTEMMQTKEFPPHNSSSVRLGAAVRAQQYKEQKRSAAIEVDFYNNPTILSRLILNEKYSAAMRRVYDFPRETYVWVCTKRIMSVVPKNSLARTQSTSSSRILAGEGLAKPESNRGPLISKTIGTSSALVGNKSDTQEIVYSLRQLPIHVACANLRRTHDSKMKKLLNDLIANLIFANPDGAHQMDHNGRYPIHEAIWHGATAETVSLFLLAKPSSLHLKDSRGRSLQEVNKFGPGTGNKKVEIKRILELDEEFWKQARKEAMFRLLRKSVKWPSDSSSIGSLSVLASSKVEDESITTLNRVQLDLVDKVEVAGKEIRKRGDVNGEESEGDSDDNSQGSDTALASLGSDDDEENKGSGLIVHSKVSEPEMKDKATESTMISPSAITQTVSEETIEVSGVTPLSWDQLEARALASEQILMDMNEQYYEMSKKVEALSVLGEQHHNELAGEVTRLSRENNALNNNLHRLELILTKISDLGEDSFNNELRKACTEVASASKSLMDLSSTESSYDSNEIEKNERLIRDKLGALSQNHFKQRERIRRLAHTVGKLVLQEGAATAAQSELSSTSSMSALTSRSAKSYWSQAKLKQDPIRPIVDHIPDKTMEARKKTKRDEDDDGNAKKMTSDEEGDVDVVDNLDDVYKLAAVNDVQVTSRGKFVRLQSRTHVTDEKKLSTHPSGDAVFMKDDLKPNAVVHVEEMKKDEQEAVAPIPEETPRPGRAQRRNSILVRPEAAKAMMEQVLAASKGNTDIDVPVLIPEGHVFEMLKVSDLELRIFKS